MRNNKEFLATLNYCKSKISFKEFSFNLPLIFQVTEIENSTYEDFISYQTTNEDFFKYVGTFNIHKKYNN